jgi:Trypsin-co-occurring domain 1
VADRLVGGSVPTSVRLDRAQDAVKQAFDRLQTPIAAVAVSTAGPINQSGKRAVRPDETKVKFGLKFSAQGNVIVAGAASRASLEVTFDLATRHVRN